MPIHKRTKKKKFVSAAVLVTSVYASILFTAGMIAGYLIMKWFYKKYVEKGPLRFLYIDFKGWKIHFHHWIFGALIITYFLVGGWRFGNHEVFLGIFCGIIAHDIYDFNDWHKVIERKRKTAEAI